MAAVTFSDAERETARHFLYAAADALDGWGDEAVAVQIRTTAELLGARSIARRLRLEGYALADDDSPRAEQVARLRERAVLDEIEDEPSTCPVCDGIHGVLCPIESPDPGYYADEMRNGR